MGLHGEGIARRLLARSVGHCSHRPFCSSLGEDEEQLEVDAARSNGSTERISVDEEGDIASEPLTLPQGEEIISTRFREYAIRYPRREGLSGFAVQHRGETHGDVLYESSVDDGGSLRLNKKES